MTPVSKSFRILPPDGIIGWPRCHCPKKGDLGCLFAHAKSAGFCAEQLASSLGICSKTLRGEFQRNYGIPLKQWLIQVRALEVRRRLRGSEGIKEIALSVGFSHSKELSREFNRIYKVTPSAFRRKESMRSSI